MQAETEVKCEHCSKTAPVYTWALHSQPLLESSLPIGWSVLQEWNPLAREREIKVFCPEHRHDRAPQ